MQNKNPKVVPAEQDGMPPEVATEMLFSKRLTNHMRKTCNAARDKVCPSTAPIHKTETGYEYRPDRHIEAAVKFAKRVRSLTFCQLNSHHGRVAKRRAKTLTEYLRIMACPKTSDTRKRQAEAILLGVANRLEQVMSALATEIRRRQVDCCGTRE